MIKAGVKIIMRGKINMKKGLFVVMLTVTVCSMSYAETALNALKGSAGSLSVVGVATPPAPVSDEKVMEALTTVVMELPDVRAMIGIFDRVSVKGKAENADCYSTEAVIESSVLGFNPATWSIIFVNSANFTKGKKVVPLTGTEIPAMITMFDRLHVASIRRAEINLISTVLIKSRTCNMRPAVWTVTYKKNPKFD